MDYIEQQVERLHLAVANSSRQQRLRNIKSNANELNDVLTLRVNSQLKKDFIRVCKLNQSSASSELKKYMLKVISDSPN